VVKNAGLDIFGFHGLFDQKSRYPKYDNKLFMVPMDIMTLEPEVNLDHLKEAGLDPDNPRRWRHGDRVWRKPWTKRDVDKSPARAS